MNFKPLHNYVLLELLAEESVTAGGIIIPDSATEKPSRGRVIAAGPGAWDDGVLVPMTVKAADVVLFAKWSSSANEIRLDGRDYVLVRETDILGVL